MSVLVRSNALIISNHLKKVSKLGNTSFNSQTRLGLVGVSRNFLTSCKLYKESKNELNLVSRVEKTVKQYGYVEVKNLDLDISIKPACPVKYPDMNTAIYSFYSKTTKKSPDVVIADEKLSLQHQNHYPPVESHCSLEVPIKYDIDLANILGENSVNIESLESGSIRVTTGSGNITSKNIKGDFISLLSQSGKVKCLGMSQGRVIIQSGSGDIHGNKFQGPSLKVATKSGNITAESIYSDASHFVSATGNVTLKNLHRQCNVKITGSGNLSVSGMDGSLDAQLGQGRHQIQISQLQGNSSVRIVHGSLTLKVPEDCPFGIRVTARSIVTPEKMRTGRSITTDESCSFDYRTDDPNNTVIEIEAKHSQVVIENEDWFASLQLGSKLKV